MPRKTILNQPFFQQSTLTVAENLLGKHLVRTVNNTRLIGKIVETEAYIGEDDSACHASKGLTPRTEIMFGPAGFAYIYLVYGMHFMFNIVTESADYPAAVLIRGIEPLDGLEKMGELRKSDLKNLSNGPAKLCQAFNINKSLNTLNLTLGKKLWLEDGIKIQKSEIIRTTRVGIDYANQKDRDAKWRFYLKNNNYVSRK